MKTLVLYLCLLEASWAVKFLSGKYDGKACYKPKFDEGIKEIMWVKFGEGCKLIIMILQRFAKLFHSISSGIFL